MASYEILIAFLVAASVFAFMPGPAMIYVAAQTMARGRRAGWLSAVGVSVGGFVHVLAAAAGLSALFAYVPQMYTVLKLCGALYLVWLGISIIRARMSDVEVDAGETRSARRAFADSILVEVLNPKTAIFFIAFLPQFVDPAAALPIWVQFLALGTIVNLLFGLGDVVAVLGAAFILARVKASPAVQRLIRWSGGGLLVGLGVKLATDRTGP